MSRTKPAIAFALPQARSRVGNGSALLEGIDGRSAAARRYKELLAQLTVELTRYGDRITEARMILARRAAALTMLCEQQEAQIANGEKIDVATFTAATNALRRVLSDSGLVIPPRE